VSEENNFTGLSNFYKRESSFSNTFSGIVVCIGGHLFKFTFLLTLVSRNLKNQTQQK